MLLSQNIKLLRKQKGVSQQILGDELGLTRQAIAAYEKGIREPDVETISHIADFFEVSIDYLVGRVDSPQRSVYEVSKNIKKIRSRRTYNDFSKDIGAKTGLLVMPEVLESFETGEKIPHISALRILANYAEIEVADLFKKNGEELNKN